MKIARVNVGWIGLGQIGLPMALRLLDAGHAVFAHSRRGERAEFIAAGGRCSDDIREVVANREVVCINVFNDEQLRDVLLGSESVLDAMRPGALLITHTTGSPTLARELETAARARAIDCVDATFSGDAAGTAQGRLAIMIGGTPAAYVRARDIVSAYADYIVHAGPAGAGQILKLLNNALFAAQVQLGADTLRVAESAGLSIAQVADTLARSSGGSYAMALLRDHQPMENFLAGIARYLDKDLQTAAEAAVAAGLNIDSLLQAAARR